jgi:hypothetical protein
MRAPASPAFGSWPQAGATPHQFEILALQIKAILIRVTEQAAVKINLRESQS